MTRSLRLVALGLAGLFTAASLPGVAAAGGDVVYLEQTVKTSGVMGQPGQNSVQKVWMSDTGYRLEDSGAGVITILRNDTGMMYMVNTAKKEYTEVTMEQMKALAEMGTAMLSGMGGGEAAPKTSVNVTDETAEVAGYKAYKAVVTVTGPINTETTMWMARDVGVDMKAWAKLAESMGAQKLFGDAISEMTSLEGYPVKQDATVKMMGMEITSTTEVTKIEHVAAAAGRFAVPGGFKKTEGMFPGMPSMPTK